MTLRSVLCLTAALELVAVPARPAPADTLVPLEQDRFTSVVLWTDCLGRTSDGEAAERFEPFDSSVTTEQQCPEVPIFATASAHQISSIGASSMTAFASAQYAAQSPGSLLADAVSNFEVTFELPRTSLLFLTGVILGDGQVPGAATLLELTGLGGTVVFSQAMAGPFPPGEPTEQSVQEHLALDPGVYTLHARAQAADLIDIAHFFAGESALNLDMAVSVLGDLDGDENRRRHRSPFDAGRLGTVPGAAG